MRIYATVDEIIEQALLLIASHPLFLNPVVTNVAGAPVPITQLRTFDGVDLNSSGLTLSIYPYAYTGTSNETVSSTNASITYSPYNVGSRTEGFDVARLNLMVRLHYLSAAQDNTPTPTLSQANTPVTIIKRSSGEKLLYQWLTVLRTILLDPAVCRLNGLINNSEVHWGTFKSTKWDQGPNYVLHTATMLWSMDFYAPRQPQVLIDRLPLPGHQASWHYVGIRSIDQVPVYWDSINQGLFDLGGYPILFTPQKQRVEWYYLTGDGTASYTGGGDCSHNTIVGVGTHFLTQVQAGDIINLSSEVKKVTAVTSDTVLVVGGPQETTVPPGSLYTISYLADPSNNHTRLTTPQLVDPRLVNGTMDTEGDAWTPPVDWVQTDLTTPVALLRPSNKSVYWNMVAQHLQLINGTIVTQDDHSNALTYDQCTQQVVPTGNNPDDPNDPNNPVAVYPKAQKVFITIFDANGLHIVDTTEF